MLCLICLVSFGLCLCLVAVLIVWVVCNWLNLGFGFCN